MRSVIRRFPAILFLIGVAATTGALARELYNWSEPTSRMAAAIIAGYLCWIALEIRVTARTSAEQASAADRGSEQLYGLARMVTVLAALYGPYLWHSWHPAMLASPLLLLLGIGLRLAAIRTLGPFYSHRVRTLPGHQIARTGPYQVLRHPAYAGMIVAHVGLVSFFLNVVSVLALITLFIPAIVRRILVEERALATVPGYPEFAVGRKRLVPFVW